MLPRFDGYEQRCLSENILIKLHQKSHNLLDYLQKVNTEEGDRKKVNSSED